MQVRHRAYAFPRNGAFNSDAYSFKHFGVASKPETAYWTKWFLPFQSAGL
jgi:hypothetical protein